MKKEFAEKLFNKHQKTEKYPSTSSITNFTIKVLEILFPALSDNSQNYQSPNAIVQDFQALKHDLTNILLKIPSLGQDPEKLSKVFFEKIDEVYELLQTDIEAIV